MVLKPQRCFNAQVSAPWSHNLLKKWLGASKVRIISCASWFFSLITFDCFYALTMHPRLLWLVGIHDSMHQGSRCILMAAILLHPWSDIYGSDTLLCKIPNPVLASRSPSPEESIDRGSIDRGRFFFTLMWIATCHGCSSSVCAIFMISFLASHNQACLRYCNTTFCAPRVALPPA